MICHKCRILININMKMIKISRWILCHFFAIHIFTKTASSKLCGERCCVNFDQSLDGDCLECPLGTNGANCTENCVDGSYGRLCQSQCNCPAEICDPRHGCPKTNTAEGTENKSEGVKVTYALIGSVTTMSLIGLLLYLKSWFSKTNASCTVTNQFNTDQTENQEEHAYESRRNSSSSETETVPQRTQNHRDFNNYTDLRFPRMLPLYDNSKECGPESETSSQRALNEEEMKDDNDDTDREGEYEQYSKHEQYNVSLKENLCKPPIEKMMISRSVDSSTNLEDNTDGMHNEYESIEMKNKEECANEIREIKGVLYKK